MKTFNEVHNDCNKQGFPCSYWGEYGEWLTVAGQSRDSDILERANWQSFIAELDSLDSECYTIERESHWAVGWVETLLVDPTNRLAIKLAETLLAKLEDYPILDEDLFSSMEFDEYQQAWEDWGRRDYCELLARWFDERPRIAEIIEDFTIEDIDELAEPARQLVNWEYQSESSGVVINLEGLADETESESIVRLAFNRRPKRHVIGRSLPDSYPYDPRQRNLL